MSNSSHAVDEATASRATIPRGEAGTVQPPTVEELAAREGLDPVQKLRIEFENKLALQRRESQIESDVTLFRHLRTLRRKLHASVKMREDLQRSEKEQLAEVERDIEAVRQRIPPAHLKRI